MKGFAIVALAICLPLAAHAQQNQPSAPSPKPQEPFTPGLGEIMTLQQMRHLKLWFAGEAGNWPLAGYELDELKEGFEDVVKYFPTKDNVPTGTMATAVIDKEVAELSKAIEAKDKKQFAGAFDRLTASCNACHQASKHAFIVIRRPAANPYANQSFVPVRDATPHKY
jgi:hypothetical protein